MTRPRFNLATKITLACAILICAPVALAWAMGIYDRIVAERIGGDLAAAAEEIERATNTKGSSLVDDAPWLDDFAQRHAVFVRVLDGEGKPVAKSQAHYADGRVWKDGWRRAAADFFFGPSGPPDLLSFESAVGPVALRREVVASTQEGRPVAMVRQAPGGTMQVFYRVVPLPQLERTVYITQTTRRSARALYDYRFQIMKLTIALLLAAGAMAAWLGWTVIGPIRRLQSNVRAYLLVGGAQKLAMSRADEIGDLSQDFNALTQRLQNRLEHTARVTADFAHDLKNPIASVAAAAELLDGDGPIAEGRRARLSRVVGDAAAHMERSVDAMLTLARLDEDLPRQPRGAVDIGELLTRVLEGRNVSVKVDGRPVVAGIESRLEELVTNLVDNALIFAVQQVEVSAHSDSGHVVIIIEDDGKGVSSGNRDKVFDRFFTQRPEGSPRGSGLGLAIARTIARAHGGTVTLEEPGALGGARFRVTLALTAT